MINSTTKTPTLSKALTWMVMVPETVAPLAGAVMETVGGVASAVGLLTVMGIQESPQLPLTLQAPMITV